MDPIENPQPEADDRAATRGLPKRLRGTVVAQDEVPPSAVARTSPERLETALAHARQCARIAEDNRAKDILLLDVRNATPLVDYFVIASAGSRRQAIRGASHSASSPSSTWKPCSRRSASTSSRSAATTSAPDSV